LRGRTVNLLTHVVTTAATVHEARCTAAIHEALVAKGLPPGEHLVDSAYVDAELLVRSREDHGIALVGPGRPDPAWQTRVEGAFTLERFAIDWDRRRARCPAGKLSTGWSEGVEGTGRPYVRVLFRQADCGACAARASCTRSRSRNLKLPPRAEHEALRMARGQLTTEAGRRVYARRAGIEGTISQGVRAFGLRRSRYRGLAKTHLQHVATAAAVNLGRLGAWFDAIPRGATRTSRFTALAA
jgi:transposase